MNEVVTMPSVGAADNDVRVEESIEEHQVSPDALIPSLRGSKTHKRAGITKNHNQGQSKQRRKMAADSRRRNRSRA